MSGGGESHLSSSACILGVSRSGTRERSPVANSSAPPWPELWPSNPKARSCSTNRCRRSTRTCVARWKRNFRAAFDQYARPSLLVTHNIEEAYRLGKNLLVISRGKIAAFGSRDDIFLRPPCWKWRASPAARISRVCERSIHNARRGNRLALPALPRYAGARRRSACRHSRASHSLCGNVRRC